MTPPPTIGFCGPWSRDAARGTWAAKRDAALAMNAAALRLTTGGDGYGTFTEGGRYTPPSPGIIADTRAILADCRARGIGDVLLQMNAKSAGRDRDGDGEPDDDRENDLTPDHMAACAAAWLPTLTEYRDVLLAVELDNEVNSSLRGLEREGGREAADARMTHRLDNLRAFAAACPGIPVTLGGMAGAEIETTGGIYAERLLRALAPDVHAGRIAAVADFHQYGRSLVPTCRAILRRAGWPADTVLIVGETNVNARTAADVAGKLDALLTRLAHDGADYIFGFTLGSHEAYGILPGTAAGAVWARHAAGQATPPAPSPVRPCPWWKRLLGWCDD